MSDTLIVAGEQIPVLPEPERRRLGELEFVGQRVLWKGREVALTRTETRITALLATAPGDVTYRDAYDVMRRPGFVAGTGATGFHACVRSMVKRIRRKFQMTDPDFNQIENYPCVGYRWRHPAGFRP